MSWYKDKQLGDIGERAVAEFMTCRGHQVIDLTSNPEYFKRDIDFKISGYYVEVKTDSRIAETGNLFIELSSTLDSGEYKQGWFNISEAEYLYYYDIVNDILYIYLFDDLRNYCKKTSGIKKIFIRDNYKYIEGYLIPHNEIEHQRIDLKEAEEWQKHVQ